MDDPLQRWVNQDVILDTGTPIVYIGRLVEVTPLVFLLENADMHDCREGHANKEVYVAEASRAGVTINRRTVVVMRSAIISVSRLADVMVD